MCTKMFTTMVYIPTSAAREKQKKLPGRESNPGLARDRRGYSPLYYRGTIKNASKQLIEAVAYVIAQRLKPLMRRYREDVHKNVHNDDIHTSPSATGKAKETPRPGIEPGSRT